MIPGGALSERLGSKWVLGVSLLSTSLLVFLTPQASLHGPWTLFGLRVLQGLASGVLYPSFPPIVKRWSPVTELSTAIAISYGGGNFGILFAYPVGGIILDKLGWQVRICYHR